MNKEEFKKKLRDLVMPFSQDNSDLEIIVGEELSLVFTSLKCNIILAYEKESYGDFITLSIHLNEKDSVIVTNDTTNGQVCYMLAADNQVERMLQFISILISLNHFAKKLSYPLLKESVSIIRYEPSCYFIDIKILEDINISIIYGNYSQFVNLPIIRVVRETVFNTLELLEFVKIINKEWTSKCIKSALGKSIENSPSLYNLLIDEFRTSYQTENGILTLLPWKTAVYCTEVDNLNEIKEIRIYPGDVSRIRSNTFANAFNLEKISIILESSEEVLMYIDDHAFANCENLREVEINSENSLNKGELHISAKSFKNCKSLVKISTGEISNSIKVKLNDSCLEECNNLRVLNINPYGSYIAPSIILLNENYKLPYKNLYRKLLREIGKYNNSELTLRFSSIRIRELVRENGMFYLPGELPLLYDIRFLKLYLNIRNIDLSEDEQDKPTIYLMQYSVDNWDDYVKYLTIYTLSYELRGRYSWIFSFLVKLIILWVIVVN